MNLLPNLAVMNSPDAVMSTMLKFDGSKRCFGSFNRYFINRSPCYSTEIAKACVVKSIGLLRVNEKKAWGIGDSSSVPKL